MDRNETKTPNYIVLVRGRFEVKRRYRVGAASETEAEALVQAFVGGKRQVAVYYRTNDSVLAWGQVEVDEPHSLHRMNG